jgi:hypothetical protein
MMTILAACEFQPPNINIIERTHLEVKSAGGLPIRIFNRLHLTRNQVIKLGVTPSIILSGSDYLNFSLQHVSDFALPMTSPQHEP